MPELRKDPVTGRWVIISTERRKRPSDFRLERRAGRRPRRCARSVAGNEDADAARGARVPATAAAPNAPGWDVRVVPNKFPALQVEGTLDRAGRGPVRPDERHRRARGDHRDARPRPDAGDDAGAGDRAGAVGVPRAHARSEAGHALPLHPDLQEPRRRGRRDARAPALAADRAADRAATSCARRSTARGSTSQHKERCVFCDIIRQELDDAGARHLGERRLRRAGAVRAAVSVRDVAPAASGTASRFEEARAARVREPGADAEGRCCSA